MMKKFLVAIVAVSTMVLGFTSCSKKADPAKEPIAGKTFQSEPMGETADYIRFTFHTNYGVTNVISADGKTVTQNSLVWSMSANAKDFEIRWANGTINLETGELVGGMLVYTGVYDAAAKKITVTLQGTKDLIQYECPEVK